MTTYSTIANASLAVGAIPSSTVVTALRDNPIAMAEAASGAPINVMGWHPVDKVSVGDGKDGIIYDFSISGTVASVVTPDFEDGYEYRIVADGLSHNSGSNQSLQVDFYFATDAAYTNVISFGSNTSGSGFGLDVTLLMPRLTKSFHWASFFGISGGTLYTAAHVVGDANGPDQKIGKVRVKFSSGSIDQGKIWLFRRREFATSP
jgi:hypothetical protein